MTFDELKKLAEGEGLKYFLAPDRPTLMMGFGCINGNYQVAALLELEGRFLQFRTMNYLFCPQASPHLEAVLRVLGTLDYQLRLTKFGWDANDGEIVGYADIWLEDGTLTKAQFHAMLSCFVPGIDLSYARISRTIETGTDPGEMRPEDLLARASGLPGLPEEVRKALEGLGRKPEPGPEPKPDEKPEPVVVI